MKQMSVVPFANGARPKTRGLRAQRVFARWFVALLVLSLALPYLAASPTPVLAANPPTQQIYFNPLPEDDLLQLFDDDEANGGTNDPRSPVRSITSLSIWSTGTWIYWDQWEDGGYDADIANPGTNVYNAATNADGTQIWGDGVLGNGCPPNINNVPNPCVAAADDQFQAGEIVILDNLVALNGSQNGPYTRNAAQIYYDGRDKFGASFPIAVTRGAFPINPGSVMAGAVEVLATTQWGMLYEAPIGDNTPDDNTNAFEDVRWFIMAGVGGATIDVDLNGDGDTSDAGEVNGLVLAQGARRVVDAIKEGSKLTVVSGNPVQVDTMAADIDDTYEFRWDALIPKSAWTNEYYTPVGTAPKSTSNNGCTEVVAYNPGASTITINVDLPGGSNSDATFTAAARSTGKSANILLNQGARLWTSSAIFLPISITDCTKDTSSADGRMYDWGTPLFPANQLTSEVLVGWAPGCSNESLLGICDDADISNKFSRNVVWVTAAANTTIYVDTNGSGITCPGGAGAEQTQTATALTSYRFDDDPTAASTVRDDFATQAYTLNTGSANWSTNWTESGDDNSATAGDIMVNGTTDALEFNAGAAGGDFIRRTANLTGQVFADLTFSLTSSGTLDATDDLALDVSNNGGSTWRTLAVYEDDPLTSVKAVVISQYISSNTTIRFRAVDTLETGDYWQIDQVQIKYASNGDYDMTGARIKTCDGTPIAAAWGQNPALSDPNDEEALDMGAGVTPFGARLRIEKSGSDTEVPVGTPVTYTYVVDNLSAGAVSAVGVTDNKCSPATYVSGDTDGDNLLDPYPTERWTFSCVVPIYVDTQNVAYAYASPDGGATTIYSPPDEWQVTVTPSSAIGNYVWLDENGDGLQDAGEPGIGNVLVRLTGTDVDGNTVNMATVTDANGGYVFRGLPASNGAGYTVTVYPPSGVVETYDENDTTGPFNTPNATTTILGVGVEHMTADFGYRWVTDPENPPPGAKGALGDRVWFDADRDGIQDTGEAGLRGWEVTLYYDPDGDGVYDTPYTVGGYVPTTTTDATGNYIFDDLPAGAYVVKVTPQSGYTQWGDPDDTRDHKTTYPIVLAPGDVYLNADFGYCPSNDSAIGDLIWFDANGNEVYDPGADEAGIPGVTVALARDDGDGIYEPEQDHIIATDITDENGLYLFPGLPAGTYYVVVDDTEHVLGELAPTYDPDGGDDNHSKVIVDGATDNLLQDFGYAPPGTTPGTGLIGDTVWLDRDADNQVDPGEGLEGVKLILTDPGMDGILDNADDTYRYTYTDENGNYAFGGLEPTTSYRVTVDTTTLPQNVGQLSNTFDPDGLLDSTTVRNLSVTGPVDLAADFAYRDLSLPNTISGTLWRDTDADGLLEPGEPQRFAGITMVLRDQWGDVIASTTTDTSGNYSFTGLPDGTYWVDVTDDVNILNGYWKSETPTPGADGTSQQDPYRVAVAGGQTNTTADFGYYRAPGALGDFVWVDSDGDGQQDAGEPGIPNVKVTLLITYPNGDTTTMHTLTNASGLYFFDNLLLDEDYIASGVPGPTFKLTVTTPAGYLPTLIDTGNDSTDSDNPAGVMASVTQGVYNPSYDFGYVAVAALGDRVWVDADADGVQDAGEVGLAGVTVNVRKPDNSLAGTTTTDANGAWSVPGLAPGSYYVEFVAPSGYVFSPKDAGGNDGTDSDADPATGKTITTVLTSGENDVTWDAGLYRPASVGDRVWLDADGDGVQDAAETTGIAGVTVTLYKSTGVMVSSTTTNASGNYSFTNQLPGSYYIIFTEPAAYDFSPLDQGGNDATDSDANTTTGRTANFALAEGQSNTTVDAGVLQQSGLGDLVWNDLNGNGVQEAGEPGLAGVTVEVYYAAGGLAGNALTDSAGLWNVDGLLPGNYYVKFTPPTGFIFSPKDVGGDDAKDSDPDRSTGVTATTTLTAGESDMTWDAGLYRPATLGDKVWNDVDGDGFQDAGEAGLPGVVVNVRRPDDSIAGTATSGPDGSWSVGGLPAGTYYIEFVPPAGYVFGPANVGNDATDSDADPVTHKTATTTLDAAEVDNTWDAGLYQPATLGDRAWFDADADGIQDTGETGLAGVQVKVFDANDVLVGTDTTDANGDWSVGGLPAGDFYVQFIPPTGYLFSGQDAGSDDAKDSDPDPSTGLTDPTTLTQGENDNTWDAGFFRSTAIGDRVWVDVDGDGVQDTGEVGLANVLINVYHGDGTSAGLAFTDSNGYWSLTDLAPGDYYVVFDLPSGYIFSPADQGGDDAKDSDPNRTNGRTATTALAAGETDLTWDAGVYRPATLGDRVWVDTNGNGLQDTGEVGLPGATVNVYPAGCTIPCTPIGTDVTDANGLWSVDTLPAGDFYVEFIPPAGYIIGPTNQGSDDAKDSDPDPTTHTTATTTVSTAEVDNTWDAGMFLPATLGDKVWNDLDGDGIQDANEVGLPGVTVKVHRATDNVVVGTDTTDANGDWSVGGLPAGDFYIEFVPPTNYIFSPANVGADDAVDSDPSRTTGMTAPTTLTPGENDLTWDAGLYLPATLGDKVWDDLDGDGQQDAGEAGLAGVTVNVRRVSDDVIVGTDVTDSGGIWSVGELPAGDFRVEFVKPSGYIFTPANVGNDATDSDPDRTTGRTAATTLTPGEVDNTWDAGLYRPSTLGDKVWVDTNGNGVQDTGESGLPGVTVNVYHADGTPAGTDVTDANGLWSVDDLPAGDFYVEFVPLPGYAIAPANLGGDDAADSDPDPTTHKTATTTVTPAEVDNTWDAGMYIPATLGNLAWTDTNANGLQDAGEAGLANVGVIVHRPDGSQAGTATTDANGAWSVGGLLPGNYYVEFVPPANYLLSLPNVGSDDAVDSDPDQSTRLTATTTLISGEVDNTWDAGLYRAATIGDKVWGDTNADGIQDAREVGLAGITVSVFHANGSPAGSAVTDSTGLWSVGNLQPGDYYVEFVVPVGYGLSPQDATTDTLDSDPDPLTARTITTTLVSGENDTTWDAGMYPLVPGYTVTKTRLTAFGVGIGRKVQFRIRVTNSGDLPITFLPLQDTYDKNYLTYGFGTDHAVPASDDNTDDGILNWTDLIVGLGHPLAVGQFIDVIVNFTGKADTTPLPGSVTVNTALVHGAIVDDGPGGLDPQTLPDQSSQASVQVLLATGTLLDFFIGGADGQQVDLAWQTASEATILGFNILRRTEDGIATGGFVVMNGEFIPAAAAGQHVGETYAWADADVPAGDYTYRLEVIGLDGSVLMSLDAPVTVAEP